MKKRIIVMFMVFFTSGFLFAGTRWTKDYHTDVFGDKISDFSVYSDFLSGSYSTKDKSNGKLSYDIEINNYGTLFIYLYEDFDTKKSLSVSPPYTVQIKYSDGRIVSFKGTSMLDSDYVENIIYVSGKNHDFRYDFINHDCLRIVITSQYGTYNLGSVDTSGVDSLYFFDKSLYNEGLSLMVEGKYEEAIAKFNELKNKDKEAFEYYKASESIEECIFSLAKIIYDTGLSLMAEGKYEEAIEKFNELKEINYKAYKHYKVEISHNECYLKLGSCSGYKYVFYDKGYYSDGWRFLEAAPADLILLKNGTPTVDSSVEGYSGAQVFFIFGYYKKKNNGNCLYVNGTTEYNSSNCTTAKIGAGKRNTELLVGAMSSSAYSHYSGSSKTSEYAAKLCSDLVYNGFDDWFLPSKDELNLMYKNLYKAGQGGFASDYFFWSSSEYSTKNAWEQYFRDGDQDYNYRGNMYKVRPVRAF